MLTKYVDRINIIGSHRVAHLIGSDRTHGLGAVGEPLAPYLGARAEGYEVALGNVPPKVYVQHVDLPRLPSGFYRRSLVDFDALGAPDVSLDDWTEGVR